MAKEGGSKSSRFSPDDVVLGKVKGYPSWPAIVVDAANVPKSVVKQKTPGTVIVRFFPDADYSFNKPSELRLLDKREIDAYLGDPPKKGSDKLIKAYKIAQNPAEWNDEQNEIVREAEEDAEEQQDELEGDDGEEEEAEVVEEKKKSSNSKNGNKKKAPPSTESSSDVKKRKLGNGEAKGTVTPSKEDPNTSVGDVTVDAEGDGEEKDPNFDRLHAIRHALQRAFVRGPIDSDSMPAYSQTLTEAEKFDGINARILVQTKVHKVLKKMLQLEKGAIPRDVEFKISERSKVLLDKWQEVIAGAKKPEAEGAAAGTDA